MSNIANDIAAQIIVTDYKNDTTTLSSYNLPITPFYFSSIISNNIGAGTRVVWYFGDGETSTDNSPVYYYKKPGSYDVNLYVYDANNQARLAAQSVTVTVEDLIEDNFNVIASSITADNGVLTDPITITQTIPVRLVIDPSLTSSTTVLSTTTIKSLGFLPTSFEQTATITREVIVDTPTVTPTAKQISDASVIQYRVSGSNTTNYFYLEPNKYNHLEAYNTLIKKEYIPALSGYEHVPISKINVPLSAVYAKIDNNSLLISLTGDSSTILVGYSGSDVYYYRDDFPTNSYNLIFSKPTRDYSNPLSIILNGSITENLIPGSISITSNGIDGDGGVATSFDIDKNKFDNGRLNFVAKIKDNQGNNIKNIGKLTLNDPTSGIFISLNSYNGSSISYTLCSLQETLSNFQGGGFFRGYFEIPNTSAVPLTGLYISARIYDLDNLSGVTIIDDVTLLSEGGTGFITGSGGDIWAEGGVYLITESDEFLVTEANKTILLETFITLSGNSTYFNVYPLNYYTLYKQGEEFDGEAMYKSLRFQETLLDKEVFFGEFLGSIFGDETSDVEALGKKVYERIRNFVDNTTNIDTAEIVRMLSQGDLVGYKSSVFDNNLTNFPNMVQRIVSLLSVNKNKLFGEKNKFAENFNTYNNSTKDTYGKNLGNAINTNTYIISSTTDLVAYEKFSRSYKLLNTYQPLCASTPPSSTYYKLSDYNSTWGWPLLIPTGGGASDLTSYYDFYEYNNVYADNIVGGVLNFDLTTVDFDSTLQELIEPEGIYENIILDTLYQSLSLTK